MKRGPYKRRAPAAGIARIAADIPAHVGAPTAYFVMDGQSVAFLPIIGPHVEFVPVFQSRRAA